MFLSKCVAMLCAKELCVTKMYGEEFVWQYCVWKSRAWQCGVWKGCVWQRCMRKSLCDNECCVWKSWGEAASDEQSPQQSAQLKNKHPTQMWGTSLFCASTVCRLCLAYIQLNSTGASISTNETALPLDPIDPIDVSWPSQKKNTGSTLLETGLTQSIWIIKARREQSPKRRPRPSCQARLAA